MHLFGEIKVCFYHTIALLRFPYFGSLERQEIAEAHGYIPPLSFTYVQGMNVLAAPFLYTFPSELEAFFCFSRFIESSCPLYVQQTLEGVHRGLKVCEI